MLKNTAAKEKVLFTWSGGKDSALALYELKKSEKYEITALLTTFSKEYDRSSMHGVRRVLLEKQAKSLGLAQEEVFISKSSSNDEYEREMRKVLLKYKTRGIESVAFGDIFLEDLKKYRETNLSKIGMRAVFPVWKQDTKELAYRFIDSGFKAIVTCVDTKFLPANFAGRNFDKSFLADLGPKVDPSGENGEFHTFVYDGPIFREPVLFDKGEIVLRDNRFYYCNLISK